MKEREKTMSEMDKQEFEKVINAMTEEEKKIALNSIDTDMLWDELRRRETAERNMLQGVKDLVNVCK